jgi:hypothetical protein
MAVLSGCLVLVGSVAGGRPEYREHFEVCIYNEGVNIWRHSFEEGKPSWVKGAVRRESPYVVGVHHEL